MADTYLSRVSGIANASLQHGWTQCVVDANDLRRVLAHLESAEAECDELHRDVARLEMAMAMGKTVRPKAGPLPEMCCGGTCVRAVCFIHGASNG